MPSSEGGCVTKLHLCTCSSSSALFYHQLGPIQASIPVDIRFRGGDGNVMNAGQAVLVIIHSLYAERPPDKLCCSTTTTAGARQRAVSTRLSIFQWSEHTPDVCIAAHPSSPVRSLAGHASANNHGSANTPCIHTWSPCT